MGWCRGWSGWSCESEPRAVSRRHAPRRSAIESATYYYWVIKEHFGVRLFCGITPFRARPTRETLRGLYGRPGDCRGARGPACAFEEVRLGAAAAGRAQEHRADGGAPGPRQRPTDASVPASFGGQGALERRSTAGTGAQPGIPRDAEARCGGGLDRG